MPNRPVLVALLDFGILVAAALVTAAMIPAAALSLPTPASQPSPHDLIAQGLCGPSTSVTTLPGFKSLWIGGLCRFEELTSSIDIHDWISGQTKPAGFLTKARYDHSALRMTDGRVLIVGGEGPDRQPTREVEIYDPSKLKSHQAGSIVTPRCVPSLTQLLDGEVLVTGGMGCQTYPVQAPVRSIEIYNPRTGSSRIVGEFKAELKFNRDATLLKDGRVLFTGGVDAQGNLVGENEIYDPSTNKLTAVAAMTVHRCGESIVALPDGSALFAGGVPCGIYPDNALKSAEIFDPRTNQFRAVGEMKSAQYRPGIALLKDGRVLLAGGSWGTQYSVSVNSAELYDPKSQTFSPTGNLTTRRSGPATQVRPDGTVLIQGGAFQGSPAGSVSGLSNSETYDPVRGEFTAVPEAPRPAAQ